MQITKKRSCVTVQKSKGRRDETLKFEVNTSKLKFLFPNKGISIFFLYCESSQNKLKATPNAVDLAMYLLMHRAANAGVNQPATNLKPRISAITNVNSENVKICTRRLLFCSNVCDVSGLN